ncbi:MAG: YIP1 family protein [Candidatus Sericytochromatia bacterium]
MEFLDNVYSVLFNPKYIFENFFNRKNFINSFFIIFILSLINAFSFNTSFFVVPFSFLFSFFIIFTFWFLLSIVLTFTSDILGGEGKLSNTMTAVAYSLLPFIFVAPLNSVEFLMDSSILTSILKFLLSIWSLLLLVLSLKNAHKYQVSQAIFSILGIIGFTTSILVGFIITIFFGIFILASSM